MNRFFIALLISYSIIACKSKNEEKPEVPAASFFPVKDYFKGQVAKLDTAKYSFLKIETTDGRSDTTAIKNNQVRQYAKDFLDVPDISSKELKDDYEITHLYDEELEAFAFTFTTKEDHPVKSEHVVLDPMPNAEGKNDIRSIFIDMWQNGNTASLRKNMLWEADKSFQVTTTTEASGKPASIKRIRIVWNGFEGKTTGEKETK